jgi:hypothetical protein
MNAGVKEILRKSENIKNVGLKEILRRSGKRGDDLTLKIA